ncbi:MAG: PAS domain S-box protein [Anaerolineae bacterium]|nr:PAS domain S-box protein [Anaerolineae bacterium]
MSLPKPTQADQAPDTAPFTAVTDAAQNKTKAELIEELTLMRQQIAKLQAAEEHHLQVEKALLASQERFTRMAQQIQDGIIIIENGKVVYVNDRASEIFGYSKEELKDLSRIEIADPDEEERLIKIFRDAANGKDMPEALEFWIVHKDGTQRCIHSRHSINTKDNKIIGRYVIITDVTERRWTEEMLERRNRELESLNRASQTLISTLDLDEVLINVLEEVRWLLNVVASSIWLQDPDTGELVCRQATGPESDKVRGWRVEPGQGFVGLAAIEGQSLIISDTHADGRHFKGVDQKTGLNLRSILSVPLRAKEGVIGVLQVVDTKANRFQPTDMTLLEPLATTAAMVIENAQLYTQVRQEAETNRALLNEVNHRVKNNLTSIMGIIELEMQHPHKDLADYQATLQDLQSRIRGLATVHNLLSATQWQPLDMDKLILEVIHAALSGSPIRQNIEVNVTDLEQPILLGPKHATALALIINELTTNSIKHAFPEREAGQITVDITIQPREDVIHITFRDNGGGWPENVLAGKGDNVGLRLVRMTLRSPMRGTLELYNDDGAVITLTFKHRLD